MADVIVGVGIDAVGVSRMKRALARTPRLTERVFTSGEVETARNRASFEASLAVRWAAKEACRKAVGRPLPWLGVEVVSGPDRAPTLRVEGCDDLTFHVSLTHTDDVAMAVVVAEG